MFHFREVNIISCDQICDCFLLAAIISIATLNKLFDLVAAAAAFAAAAVAVVNYMNIPSQLT